MSWNHALNRGSRGAGRIALSAVFVAGLLLSACDDDSKKTTGPDDDDSAGAGELFNAAVFCGLRGAVEQAVGLLFLGGGTVPGDGGGQILVEGGNFTFDEYSPDGVFVIDGAVVLDLLATPATVKGGFDWTRGEEGGEILVDMTVEGTSEPITYGGTLTFDGQAVDLSTVDLPDCAD